MQFCVDYNHIIKTKLESVSLSCKSSVLKQQISQFYSHILSTKASYHIYTSHRPVIYVKTRFCLEIANKTVIFAVLERWLLQLRESDSSFVLIIFAVLLGKI